MAEDCCPARLQGVIDAGAARLGLHAAAGMPAGVAGLIDHTLLKADAARSDIEQLCREAAEFGFATVCVNPTWAALEEVIGTVVEVVEHVVREFV